MTPACWYRDEQTWRFVVLRYLPWLAALNLGWEVAQLPLYTIWSEAAPGYIAFAVAHCTLGDLLIGMAALALALLAGRESRLAKWHWLRIACLAAAIGVTYTAFSEWMNTSLARWTYSELMPVVELAGMKLGLSPLVQWLVIPPLALLLARHRASMRCRSVPRAPDG